MDDFALQRSLARHILKARPGVAAGMKHVISTLESKSKSLGWNQLRDIDWDKGLARWVAWMDTLCRKLPPPAGEVEMLWFEAPSELNPALTSVSAWAGLGAKEDSYGVHEGRVWPVKKNGTTAELGLHPLTDLDKAWKSVGWSGKVSGTLRPGVFATGYAYVLLLVLNGLPKTALARSLGTAKTIGVVTGWAEGDIDAVGGLKAGRWVAMPKVKRVPARAFFEKNGDLSVEYAFDPERYLKDGGDPAWRHRKTGGTLLHEACRYCDDIRQVRAVLDAGADVNALQTGREGSFTFLDLFGAGDVDIIRLVLKRGAKLGDGRNGRPLYFDEIVQDGRCTVEHLHLLEELEVSVPKARSPLHDLGADNLYEPERLREIRKQLDFWLKRGQDINSRDKEGRTPLWVGLHYHAEELAEHVAWLKKNKDNGGDWDYAHDRVAIEMLERGADPNARLKKSTHSLIPDGATPLMVRRYDDDKLVLALLKAGADPHATSAEGKTALEYAQAAAKKPDAPGHEGVADVIAALTKAMAKKQTGKRAK